MSERDLLAGYITSREKDGIKGSSKHASRYTSPAEVLITREQEGWSSL
jgi:hypothetical protein